MGVVRTPCQPQEAYPSTCKRQPCYTFNAFSLFVPKELRDGKKAKRVLLSPRSLRSTKKRSTHHDSDGKFHDSSIGHCSSKPRSISTSASGASKEWRRTVCTCKCCSIAAVAKEACSERVRAAEKESKVSPLTNSIRTGRSAMSLRCHYAS